MRVETSILITSCPENSLKQCSQYFNGCQLESFSSDNLTLPRVPHDSYLNQNSWNSGLGVSFAFYEEQQYKVSIDWQRMFLPRTDVWLGSREIRATETVRSEVKSLSGAEQ